MLLYPVEQLSAAKDYRYKEKEYKVILLSGKGDPDTIFLPHEIKNDLTTPSGRRRAFTRGHRYITVERLRIAPKTTSGLLEGDPEAQLLLNIKN